MSKPVRAAMPRDKLGVINYLHEMAQADHRYQLQQRVQISRAFKALLLHRTLSEKEFAHATTGLKFTPELLYTLTVHHVRNEIRRLYRDE